MATIYLEDRRSGLRGYYLLRTFIDGSTGWQENEQKTFIDVTGQDDDRWIKESERRSPMTKGPLDLPKGKELQERGCGFNLKYFEEC